MPATEPLPGPRPPSHMMTGQRGGCAPGAPDAFPPPAGLPGPWVVCAPSLPPLLSHTGAFGEGAGGPAAACLPRCGLSDVTPPPQAATGFLALMAPRRRPLPRRRQDEGRPSTCFPASVLLMMLMILWVALLHSFRLPAEDSSGSQAFQ